MNYRIKPLKRSLMRRFTKSLAFAFYPTIYVREGYENEQWLIEHELHHLRRQKKMGKYKWLYKWLTSKKFRLQEEVAAYKISVAFGYSITRAAKHLVTHYYLDITYQEAYRELKK